MQKMARAADLGADSDLSAAERIERHLREAIIRLDLKPGTRLSEQEIADQLGVSRQPVREAIISLSKANLVEVKSKRGTFVVKISARKMIEARFVREAIETAIVRRACTSFDPWSRAQLGAILERQQAALGADDKHTFRYEDEAFHLTLATGTGCALAWDVITDVKAHIDRVCNLQLRKSTSMQTLIDEHRAIVDAIDAQDGDRAVAAMRTHLGGILSDLPKIEAENRDLFEA